MTDRDPYTGLQSPDAYGAAVRMAMASEPAELIRYRILESLWGLLEHGEPTTDYQRGYRMGLRVAYLQAGGQCNGSASAWAEIEGQVTA